MSALPAHDNTGTPMVSHDLQDAVRCDKVGAGVVEHARKYENACGEMTSPGISIEQSSPYGKDYVNEASAIAKDALESADAAFPSKKTSAGAAVTSDQREDSKKAPKSPDRSVLGQETASGLTPIDAQLKNPEEETTIPLAPSTQRDTMLHCNSFAFLSSQVAGGSQALIPGISFGVQRPGVASYVNQHLVIITTNTTHVFKGDIMTKLDFEMYYHSKCQKMLLNAARGKENLYMHARLVHTNDGVAGSIAASYRLSTVGGQQKSDEFHDSINGVGELLGEEGAPKKLEVVLCGDAISSLSDAQFNSDKRTQLEHTQVHTIALEVIIVNNSGATIACTISEPVL
jgi:hypothetical protein